MKKVFALLVMMTVLAVNVTAQSTVDTVLAAILSNNKNLRAHTQYREMQQLSYKIGLTPANPMVNYDYMKGSPETAGNQTDITVIQAFDFPTAYVKKKQLAEQQIGRSIHEQNVQRQEILNDARKTCLELVYRNKLHAQLVVRKEHAENLLKSFQSRLNTGEGNVLDVHKAQLQVIEYIKVYRENISAVNQLNQHLTGLNGGTIIMFGDTIYPVLPAVPAFEQMEAEIEKHDPTLQILRQEQLVIQKQVELSRALSFPKLETGYHYQEVAEQKFQGFRIGITVPLWENKNTVKMHKAYRVYKDLELQTHLNDHFFEIQRMYEKYKNLKETLEQYRAVFSGMNNVTLLNKAFSAGQISSSEYFLEMNYYNNAYANYLQVEKEYYEIIAELYKYQL